MTRTSARLRRPAALLVAAGMGLASLLTGCSAGQVTQTSNQVAAVPGANATLGHIALRDVLVPFGEPEGYPQGGSAPMSVRLFNSAEKADALIDVTSTDAESVVLTVPAGTPKPQPCPAASVSADAPREPASTPPSESAEPGPGATESPSGSPSASEAEQGGDETKGAKEFRVPLPSDQGCALLVPDRGPYLQLVGLHHALRPGQSVSVTFTFAEAGEITIAVPVGPPAERGSRSPLDLHEGEGGHE